MKSNFTRETNMVTGWKSGTIVLDRDLFPYYHAGEKIYFGGIKYKEL